MRGLLTSLTLICILLLNSPTSLARNNNPKGQKSRVERQATKTSTRGKQPQTKRDSRKELTASVTATWTASTNRVRRSSGTWKSDCRKARKFCRLNATSRQKKRL